MCRSRLETPVIVPKFELVGPSCGPEKTAWLNALRNSARYCSTTRSLMRVFFRIEQSTLLPESPRRLENLVGNVRTLFESCWLVLRLNRVVSNAPSTPRGFQFSGPP